MLIVTAPELVDLILGQNSRKWHKPMSYSGSGLHDTRNLITAVPKSSEPPGLELTSFRVSCLTVLQVAYADPMALSPRHGCMGLCQGCVQPVVVQVRVGLVWGLVWGLCEACVRLVWCLCGACVGLVLACVVLVWCLYGACVGLVWCLCSACVELCEACVELELLMVGALTVRAVAPWVENQFRERVVGNGRLELA